MSNTVFTQRPQLVEYIVAGGVTESTKKCPTFAPIVDLSIAEQIKKYIKENRISTVYDLGAGDLALSVYLELETNADIIAYELNEHIVDISTQYWSNRYNIQNITVKCKDFQPDIPIINNDSNSLVVMIGRSNLISPEHFEDTPVIITKSSKSSITVLEPTAF